MGAKLKSLKEKSEVVEPPIAGLKAINIFNIVAGIIGRVIFVLLSEYNEGLKDAMTDIDMTVYSQGAKAFLKYGNTSSVPEFKYSPLVALFALPFSYSHLTFKLGVAMLDILNGILYSKITTKLYGPNKGGIALTMYIYNPLIVAIACRGSFEAPCSFFVALGTLMYLNKSNLLSGICFGIAAQLRIYPIIFWPTLVLATCSYSFSTGFVIGVLPIILGLKQAFAFHVSRVDLWHNISIWWSSIISISQHSSKDTIYGIELDKILSLAPIAFQLCMSLLPALNILRKREPKNVVKMMYLQSLFFVMFSKVQTAQYWDWWLLWSCVFGSHKPFIWLFINSVFSFVGISWNNPSYSIEYLKVNKFDTISGMNVMIYLLQMLMAVCI